MIKLLQPMRDHLRMYYAQQQQTTRKKKGPAAPASAAPAHTDPLDFTKWDMCELASIPLSGQNFS